MKPRIRSILNLYYRWGFKLGLSAHETAQALEQAGMIERESPEKYREVVTEKLSPSEFDEKVYEVLCAYKGNK